MIMLPPVPTYSATCLVIELSRLREKTLFSLPATPFPSIYVHPNPRLPLHSLFSQVLTMIQVECLPGEFYQDSGYVFNSSPQMLPPVPTYSLTRLVIELSRLREKPPFSLPATPFPSIYVILTPDFLCTLYSLRC